MIIFIDVFNICHFETIDNLLVFQKKKKLYIYHYWVTVVANLGDEVYCDSIPLSLLWLLCHSKTNPMLLSISNFILNHAILKDFF